MATNSEEIITRLGWDATQVARGSAKMIADQEVAAKKVSSIWRQQSAERIMMSEKESARIDEIARQADVEQAARNNKAAALWRKREQERVAATLAADAEISAASWKKLAALEAEKLNQKNLFFEKQ